MTYTAYVMDKADREIMTITRDYPSKKEFAQELRQNGFAVKFISTPEKFNHDLETYCEKKERRNSINRFIRAELKKAAEKHTEEINEEPQQEEKNMTASREFLNITTKKRYDAIQVDTDTSYYVKNATDETAATRYALEKFLNKLETIGTREAETIADIIRTNLKNDEFMFTYNSISEGGNAWEIEINDYCDGTMSIYIRIAEYMCDASEEPAADQAEEPAAEKPAENETDSAFIAEMFAALDYFKRVLWSYTEIEGGTRSERDISGDFWGAHECRIILSFVNNLLKAQGVEPLYKLKNDFDDLTECFEEIMQKFEYGDERTIEEIISEYNFS